MLEAIALGARDDDTLSSLAGRLARLERTMTEQDRFNINAIVNRRGEVSSPMDAEKGAATGGAATAPVRELANALLDAIDPDKPIELVEAGDAPALEAARAALIARAVKPFDDPQLRKTLIEIQARDEQTIDRVSIDRVREAGFSAADTDRARATIESFQQFIEQHKDEIAALQLIYAQPFQRQPLTFRQVKELAEALRATT